MYCRHLLHRCEDAGLPNERNSIPPAVFAGVVPYGADGLLAAFSLATAVRWYFFPGMVVIFPVLVSLCLAILLRCSHQRQPTVAAARCAAGALSVSVAWR